MTTALNLDQLVRLSAASMMNCILEGTAIGLFAWILLRAVGRRNSSTRFALWFFALLAIAALPVLGVAASGARAGSAGSAITVPSSWALDIFFAWAAIAGIALLRVGVGLWQLRRLRASSTPIAAEALDPGLRATLQGFHSARSVALCQSARLQVPTAIGFVKPMVVIPSWALRELSPTELNSILIHELAHLRRWDDWTNLAQQILKALLFFHPAVWWIESQLALEREMACDDAVLAETANPRGYAQCLVSIAEKSFMRRGLALAQAAVNRMRQTSLRVAQILDTNRAPATQVWKPAVYSVAAFFVVCLISLSHAPELVAFQDQPANSLPDLALALPAPAYKTLASATDSNFLEKRAMATPVTFRAKSAETPMQTHQIQRAPSPTPKTAEYRVSKPLLVPQRIEYQVWEGTSLLPPHTLEKDSGLQPLRQANSTVEDQATPQAEFIVLQTTQYNQTAPVFWRLCIWRVTIVDSTRIPAEPRTPAKQI
jgi:beta-lactamase regulating signal transducer with metallopeptidase domain